MPRVSLYVPCYNVSSTIRACLEGVFAMSEPPDEVLVIDDCSTDDLYSQIQGFSVRVIKHEVNKGLSAARNTAFKNAQYEYVASLDADVVPSQLWLAKLKKLATQQADFGGAGGCLLESVKHNWSDHWRHQHMQQNWGAQSLVNPAFLVGANNLFKKEDVIRVGGYNELLRTNGEDHDMSQKIKALGKSLYYQADATCFHLRQDSFQSLRRAVWRYFYFGAGFSKPEPSLQVRFKKTLKSSLVYLRDSFKLVLGDLSRFDLKSALISSFLGVYIPYKLIRLYLLQSVR